TPLNRLAVDSRGPGRHQPSIRYDDDRGMVWPYSRHSPGQPARVSRERERSALAELALGRDWSAHRDRAAMLVSRLAHLALDVVDLDAEVAFYGELLGLDVAGESGGAVYLACGATNTY